jgi:hypothetical protein
VSASISREHEISRAARNLEGIATIRRLHRTKQARMNFPTRVAGDSVDRRRHINTVAELARALSETTPCDFVAGQEKPAKQFNFHLHVRRTLHSLSQGCTSGRGNTCMRVAELSIAGRSLRRFHRGGGSIDLQTKLRGVRCRVSLAAGVFSAGASPMRRLGIPRAGPG